MRWSDYIDPAEVKRAIDILQSPDSVFEVRVVGGSGRKDIFSGYFRDADTLLRNFDTIDVRGKNIYITLGEVKEECFARSQSEHFEHNPSTTSDPEIVAYRWLFIDLDPVRPAGISSSDEELRKATALADKVKEYMRGIGFKDPVFAMSGNGYHLLYRISIPNTPENHALVDRCLKNLASMFNTDTVKVDTTNANPSRICKLHGTLAQKGTSTKQRPHRMSRILNVPDVVEITDKDIIAILANELPEEPQADNRRYGKKTTQDFDLVGFMQRNGITYEEDVSDRSKIYRLDTCPFDHNHRNGDAKIFLYSNGAIAFKCHHNSCRGRKWQDVRLLFEPEAYSHDHDDERIDVGYQEHRKKREEEQISSATLPREEENTKKEKAYRNLKTAEALMKKDIPEPKVFIGVGDELPMLVEGTCILSAKPKLGKSWLALGMCIAIATGADFLGYRTQQCSTLYLDLETSEALQQKRLRKMLDGNDPPKNFYLETETDSLENGFVDQIEHYLTEDPNIGLVVIDVFQIIRSPSKSLKESEYEHAYRDITPLNELAQKHHISIVLVCHDRKAVDPDDPFSNILGSTGLQGAATQMIVMFRKHKDDPVHISIKGKTIDGLPELDVKLENAQWSIVDGVDTAGREEAQRETEYRSSDIRKAILAIMDQTAFWKGRCSELSNEAVRCNTPLTETPKMIGGFLHRHQGRFLKEDGIKVEIIDNGSGSKIYKITVATVDTVDENKGLPLMGFQNPDEIEGLEIPFL